MSPSAHDIMLSKYLLCGHLYYGASQVPQIVKNSPVMQETQVQYLAQEDLEKGEDLEKISSILAWRILSITLLASEMSAIVW